MTVVYHVTSAENANDILQNGFEGGWGDSGFGVYFYGKLYNAMAYLNGRGWDGKLDPETAVIVAAEVDDEDLAYVDIDPGWPNPEDYEDVLWHPMDDGAEARFNPKMGIAYPAPAHEAEWALVGTVETSGGGRSVWRVDGEDGRDVYQMTDGDEPANKAGYHSLDSLLSLKGVKLADLEMVTAPVANQPRI